MTVVTHSGYGYSKILCEKVSSWYLNKFHLNHELILDINHRSLKSEGATGFCYQITRSSYEIELDVYLNKTLYISTLIHELCHLSQWVNDELKIRNGKLFFQGNPVTSYELHESDAYAKENQLFSHCASFLSGTLPSQLLQKIHYNYEVPKKSVS